MLATALAGGLRQAIPQGFISAKPPASWVTARCVTSGERQRAQNVKVLVSSGEDEQMTNNKTDVRFTQLKTYCEQEVRIDPRDFHCTHFDACNTSAAEGLEFIPGGLAHVGEDFDTTLAGKGVRILFVGYDYGNCCDDLETRRASIQGYAGALNPHYRGLIKVMMEIFQVQCASEREDHLWKPLLRKMAQTNETRCCVSTNRSMRTNTTRTMQTNCWVHFRKEIEILGPTLIFFHGAALKRRFLESVKEEHAQPSPRSPIDGYERHCQVIDWTIFPKKFSSVLLFFNHPAYGHFGRQWETKVTPLLQSLRERQLLPPGESDWRPRARTDWPKI
jgi:hypothetical protein